MRLLIPLLLAGSSWPALAETLTWNVGQRHGITAEGIRASVEDARARFREHPDDVIVLELDAGTFRLEGKDGQLGTIDLSGIKPGPKGRLVIRGAGMDRTVLVFSDNIHAIAGRNVFRVTVADLHMTRHDYTVSQGVVVGTSPGTVTLDLHPGFPSPKDIFDSGSDQGRYLRRFTDSRTDPQLVVEDNPQLAWTDATPDGHRRWRIHLRKKNVVPGYSAGDLIAIKSKHGGQAYWLMGGSDFTFQSVKWTQKTRGVFRGGFDRVRILDCVTDRSPAVQGQTPCLASPGGGPQIGQPWDPPTSGNLVKNCRFVASGDDAVAFFHASGEISGCRIRDAFARGILASDSPDAVIRDNTLVRCPLQRSKDHKLPADPAKATR